MTSTSSSNRYAEAREALRRYEIIGDRVPEDTDEVLEREYDLDQQAHVVVRALRALIEPSATDEGVDEMVESFRRRLYLQGTIETLGGFPLEKAGDGGARWDALYGEAYRQGVQAGIQAAWESWEPETAPGVPGGTLEQIATDADSVLEAIEASTDAEDMDEVFEARDRAADVLSALVSFVRGKEGQ